jgi:uncharacterized membrane protein
MRGWFILALAIAVFAALPALFDRIRDKPRGSRMRRA